MAVPRKGLTCNKKGEFKMAITLKEIAKYLEAEGFNYKHDEEQEAIVSGVSDNDQSAALFIRLQENGEMFSMDMKPMNDDERGPFNIPTEHPHLVILLQQLLYANYNSKFGAWEFDPKDGDIKFTIEFPVEDGTITQKQFVRILSGAFSALDAQKRFKEILKTGVVPSAEDSESAHMIQMLEAMLAQAKSGAKGSDSDGI